ncbi:heavy metal translocating P-type ATPase [Lacicoccus qingdaonensis]|uniref:Cd(2+)-exporting ATPase n=1 Tax=Lacicoccus qingdaonensis TaxID=576118 RepID=A0A1G9AGD2_9BACL|nr:heavy metal translocating P-type ATPase [Salinicoccus qingdaonensis]SDK26338.1 Cd2+/Zn2+-exporting ATPase [Salinicoccus qingdaonensis]
MSDKCCSTTGTLENDTGHDSSCCSSNRNIQDDCCSHEEHPEVKQSSGEESMEYRIQGMDCPSCAATIEKSLQKLHYINDAKVNYNTAKLQVAGSSDLQFRNVESEVEKLGFHAESISDSGTFLSYDIAGMDCGGCAKSIENHLNKMSDVNNVSVSFATGKMKIDHSNSIDDIVSEVSKVGYRATLLSENNDNPASRSSKNGFGMIGLTGVLIAAGFISSTLNMPELVSILLYASAMVISGYKPVKSAYYAVKSGSLDMNVLMSAAAIGAVLIGEWFEGALVVWLFALGNVLQDRSLETTRNSIRNLMDLAPSEAWIKVGPELVKRLVEAISPGDTVVIKPGERVPLDGMITSGETSINQAPITGESIPVYKSSGDDVYAGTINENGSIEMEVTKLVEDTTISRIIHMVEEAQEQKAPTEAFIDKFAAIYTPIVFILALAVIVLPPVFGIGAWGEWIYRGLALLVVACPCALVISTPVAIVSAIGNAAKNGVLIKGGSFLEKAGTIDAIAFDKTGTLTEGKPKVDDVHALTVSEDELLSIARTLEEYSNHPIARTVVDYAKDKDISTIAGKAFHNITGHGVKAEIDGKVYYAGNMKLFDDLNIGDTGWHSRVEDFQSEGKTVVIVGTGEEISGILTVSDSVRPSAMKALDGLKKAGVKSLVMLTGDNEGTAKMISNQTSVNRYFAELMPEDKVNAIRKLQSEGHKVAMVGDGINDAPALAMSDLGIAMGGAGTDTAMETSDIVLMADNLDKLSGTMHISRKALTIIKQNIWFSLIIKAVALLLIVPGWLTLWMAVLSDTGAALIVILNSLRLLKSGE